MKKTVLIAALAAACATSAFAQPKKPAPAAAAKPAAAPAGPAAPGPNDWRTPDPNDVLVIDTNKGRVIVEMVPEIAPNHVQRMRELAHENFYDGQKFFRVVADFMDQTGDPQNQGSGGSSKPNLEGEFSFRRGADFPFVLGMDQGVAELGFVKGVAVATQSMMLAQLTKDQKVAGYGLFCQATAGMARSGDPNSANSQFYLMRAPYPSLNRNYTVWGRVISGQEAVTAIKVGEPVADPQDYMERVRLLADLPAKDRPKIRVIDPKGPWFKAELERVKAAGAGNFDPCDVKIPAEVK
jgi:peptidylprolyl isomerase